MVVHVKKAFLSGDWQDAEGSVTLYLKDNVTRICYDILRGEKKNKWHIPQKPGLKQERYSYLVKLMYGDKKYKKNQYNFLWHLHFLWPACDTIQIEGVMIRFGQGFYYKEGWGGGWKARMIEDPQIARLRLSAVP